MTGTIDWGWDASWAGAFESWRGGRGSVAGPVAGVEVGIDAGARPASGPRPARVVEAHRDRWRIVGEGQGALASAGAVWSGAGIRPATGDWVVVDDSGPDGLARILDVLPRRTAFSRRAAGTAGGEQVVAANVDVVWIVHGLDTPPNLRRLERYVVVGWDSGAVPVVVLTKADLAEDAEADRAVVSGALPGVDVRLATTRFDGGLDELARDLTAGSTVALLGPSGVGKSTLVNRLLGHEAQATAEVREGDRKGRHTTTSRQLVRLPGGAVLLDTPGMRELQLWDVDEGLDRTFSDIDDLASECRFRDCRHEAEPGCAVTAAVAEGTLDAGRLESFRKLRAEAEWQARREDPLARKEEVSRIREIHRSLRHHPKYRKR